MRTVIRLIGVLGLMLAAAAGNAQASAMAQAGCSTGIVRLPAGINGAISICPPVAAQSPDLARQLAAIQSAMSNQQAELEQLTRLVKDINQVSGPLGTKRQAELLTNVIARLGNVSTVGGVQLQQRASTLSGHFEDVSTQIIAAQVNPDEAAKTQAAMQGSVGDAIARLDFDTVTNQLSDIQATVHAVDQRTQQMQGTVNEIHSDTHQTEQILEQYAGQSAQMQKDMLNDASYFIRVMFFNSSGTIGGPGKIQFRAMHPAQGTLTDAKMQIVFSLAGQNPWTVDADVPKVEDMASHTPGLDEVDVPKLGDHAVVCYSAMDSRVSQRRRWTMAYRIVSQPSRYASIYASNPVLAQYAKMEPQMAPAMSTLTFEPDSVATLTPDSGTPCQPTQEQAQQMQQDTQQPSQPAPGQSPQQDEAQQMQQQIIDATRQRQQQIEQQMTEAAQQRSQTDPNAFVMIKIQAGGIAGGPGTVTVVASLAAHHPSLTESKMQILFSLADRQHWVVNVPIAPLTQMWATPARLDLPRIGDHAILCFSAMDPTSGQRRRWREAYVLMGQSPGENGTFQPASDPTLTLDSNAPCQ